MKRFILCLAASLLVATTACASLYPETMIVTGVDENEDVLCLETATGEMFYAMGIEDYCLGDLVSVIMNDMETSSIWDDEIVMLRYSGFSNKE